VSFDETSTPIGQLLDRWTERGYITKPTEAALIVAAEKLGERRTALVEELAHCHADVGTLENRQQGRSADSTSSASAATRSPSARIRTMMTRRNRLPREAHVLLAFYDYPAEH
jgi:hypothetical protein